MKVKLFVALTLLFLFILSSCTLTPLKCFLDFSDYNKTYEFNFSKTVLKDKIVEAYSYDESLFLKNLGKTTIENETINETYRKSVDVWLDKSNWDKFKSEIRQNTDDTLSIVIGKHQSRKRIKLEVVVQGNDDKSSLKIHAFNYQKRKACSKDKEYYILRLSKEIEKKFISKLKN
jgi:hypothetical protein